MGIKTSGFSELADDLVKMAERVSRAGSDKALRAGARIVFKEMRKQAKIDPKKRTGKLYESIKTGKVMKTVRHTNYTTEKYIKIGTQEQNAQAVGSYEPHAHLVEYGHGGPAPAPPHPFIRPAYDRKEDEAYAEIARVLGEEIR